MRRRPRNTPITASHDHAHAPANHGRAFAIGVSLNVAFVLVEALTGWRVHSLALIADAGHNLSDVGGLLLAWAGLAATRLRSNDGHPYGWRSASILASSSNAVILLLVMGSLGLAAVPRLRTPAPIEGGVVMVVAGVGVLVNVVTVWLFMSGSRSDLDLRGAYLHMAADALVSVGVVVARGHRCPGRRALPVCIAGC
jgi:cobalt-zinc-cadmium efflux system protein